MIGWLIIGLCIAVGAGGYYVWKQTQSTREMERNLIRTLTQVGVPLLAIHHNLLITLNRQYVRVGVVVVMQSGLIVLDVLPVKGEVIGEENDALWKCRKGNRVRSIRNPFSAIRQQLEAIRQNLSEITLPACSVVVIPEKSRVSVSDLPENSRVVHPSELGQVVCEMLDREPVLDEDQLAQIQLVLKLGAYHGADAKMQAQLREENDRR